jgi:putative FmdB family regulatory protein
MPTYEYACHSCGTHVEVYQRFSDEPLTVCGLCGGPLRKVFHPAGILFKGSGFYATDSRRSAASASRDGSRTDTTSTGTAGAASAAGKSEAGTGGSAAKEPSGSGPSTSSERSA